jgi:F0F1-type ATP synthase gamma subunit
VNSSLARALRKELLGAAKDKKDVRVVTLGDKGRAQIARDYVPVMARSFDQLFDKDANFALASAVAAKIIQEPYDYLVLYFNKYENQAKVRGARGAARRNPPWAHGGEGPLRRRMARGEGLRLFDGISRSPTHARASPHPQFHNTFKVIPQLSALKPGEEPATLKGYEVEPLDNSEAMINLQEYAIASSIFYAMLESAACETSQRVMAMDNATTNAKDMVHSLSLIYNRARQAKITTELSEIIGGASAAETVGNVE